ncbi:MAG TPA: hypothetical protein VMH32_04195 [Burkholderiales bacterium]|nr:hypothetical protein [Burkholderiales bacterium]
MRLELGGSMILFVWSAARYRTEIARLMQGLNRHLLRVVRARRLFGLSFVLVRRIPSAAS